MAQGINKLERHLGLAGVLAISMSAMLGSGLFVLPGLAAAKTGPSVWLAYLVAGLCVLPAALSKAELSTAMPTSGGSYVYIDRTFGPLAGTIAGLGLWLSLLLKSAFALVGFGAYLHVMVEVPVRETALLLLIGVTAINIVGVRAISKIGKVVVALVLVGAFALVIGGTLTAHTVPMGPAFSDGTMGLLSAAAFVYVSYAGVTKVAAIAEEVKDPARNLPLGILLSLGIVTAIYVVVIHTLVSVVPWRELSNDLHPIYTLAERIGGAKAGLVAAVLGVLTMTSMAIAGVLASSRFPFAMARDDLLPPMFRGLNRRFVTPANAIIMTAIVMALCITFLNVEKIAKLASAAQILVFMAVNATVLVLRESRAGWYKPGYRAPFYPAVQILGILLGAVLLFVMGFPALVAALAMAVPAAGFYAVYGRSRTTRTGALGKLTRRQDLITTDVGYVAQVVDVLPSEASVFVPIFGTERSAESLVEVAAILAVGRKIEVVYIVEVPEQSDPEAVLENDPLAPTLRRRIEALAKHMDYDIEFDAMVSRDIVRSIHDIANQIHCDWVVMEWRGKGKHGFGFQNQIGWLQDHLPCSLAVFRDRGIRFINEVLVYAEPGPHDALVLRASNKLARAYPAKLNFARYVSDDMSLAAQRAGAEYAEQLSQISTVATASHIVVDGRSDMKALVKVSQQFDLLVMGAAANRSLRTFIWGSDRDWVMDRAQCSVLWVKSPTQLTAHRGQPAVEQGEAINLMSCLQRSWIKAQVSASKMGLVINQMALDFCAVMPSASAVEVADALMQRERIQSTTVGRGVAMPHATLPDATHTFLGIYTTADPIDYGAPDGEGVTVFFTTVGPPSARLAHLQLLAEISKLILGTSLLRRLRAAKTPDEIVHALRRSIDELEAHE